MKNTWLCFGGKGRGVDLRPDMMLFLESNEPNVKLQCSHLSSQSQKASSLFWVKAKVIYLCLESNVQQKPEVEGRVKRVEFPRLQVGRGPN